MYKTIVIDPPWKKSTGGVGNKTLQPSTHYQVQSKYEIIKTINHWFTMYPIADEAHLYLWTINSFAAGAHQGINPSIEVCKHIGFKPITLIPWIKSNSGSPTPYGMRHTEMCIFAVKYRKGFGKRTRYAGTNESQSVPNGKGLCSSKDYITADRRQHSRKPDEFYTYVESRSNGPYLDLYSRTTRQNWTSEGNQTGVWKI